ncbi:hypothetical protein Pogu_0631 [Pyrobaculum oguniense TE7]|uniref:Uncharacterized protein n=1 Tax=Pyrobaculum oguniense (strain DSM 13380 / JCM 10595 / TE7) TaxID=698757 RepID=H6Q801_PYROT|nr:hypothetical protein Pogu_0631 [Pyrobaculum oguniense TE7]
MPNKPTNQKKKALAVAALVLLVLAVEVYAQQQDVYERVREAVDENIVSPVVSGVRALAYIWAVAFWVAVILLALYAFIMLKAGPTTFSRWSGFVEMIDRYKLFLIGIIAVPLAIAALLTGVAAVSNQEVDAWGIANQFVSFLFQPFNDVARALLGQ